MTPHLVVFPFWGSRIIQQTAPTVGAWSQLRRGLWWGHSVQRNSWAINAPASSGLGRNRLGLYWDGRLFSVTITNVNWNFAKELLGRNEISDNAELSDEANAPWSVKGLKWGPEVPPMGRLEPMNTGHTLTIILLFHPKCLSKLRQISFLR